MDGEAQDKSENRQWAEVVKVLCWKYALSSSASAIAESCTFPFDLTKTRLQIQGEQGHNRVPHKGSSGKRGMAKTALYIVKEEGFTKLWQGLSPALYRQLIYTGVRMGTYEQIRENVLKRNPDGSFSAWKAAIAGLSAGVIGQLTASPMDLVKVQMQMEGRRRLAGQPPRVHGVWHAMSVVVKSGGIKGLWSGWVPNVQRAALVNVGDLATYDVTKQAILNNSNIGDNWICHGLASVVSGFASAALGTPADVVKTRIMNQPRGENNIGLYYRSSSDCLLKTIKNEGAMSLYKGFIPIWSRMAPWSVIFWLSYEKIRNLSGTESF